MSAQKAMAVANRVALILRSQFHATSATALHEQALGNQRFADELREVAECFDLLAEGLDDGFDDGLLKDLDARRTARRLFKANGVHIDFSVYSKAQLSGLACSSCGGELKDGEIAEATILGPSGQMSRHRRWNDCDVEVPF